MPIPSARPHRVYHDFYWAEPLVEYNAFRTAEPDRSFPPDFHESRGLLPEPYGDGLDDALACYWKAWELAFRNLLRVHRGNGFVAPYVETAFNDCLFLWDSAFILLFARHGRRAFDFGRTLDNFYAKQHPDGFIARQIKEWDGHDYFHRHDPASTGPNVLAWVEWEQWRNFGDAGRVRSVLPALVGYHRWMRRHRTWPDGGYWSCGFACGMDNQPRQPGSPAPWLDHGHMTWIDATAQAALSADLCVRMAEAVGWEHDVADLRQEHAALAKLVNERMWDESIGFYKDVLRDGTHGPVKSVGAYWALLAGLVPEGRIDRFVAHLDDAASFRRPHRVPSMAADDPGYEAETGSYWKGGVWPPTDYLVLRALTAHGRDDLAHAIAVNHHENVVQVFRDTGTVWENYAPESVTPGEPARPDFVGWGGLGPIAVFLEYVLGLRADVPGDTLVVDVRRDRPYGVRRLPFGDGTVDVAVDGADVSVTTTVPLTLEVRHAGNVERRDVRPS